MRHLLLAATIACATSPANAGGDHLPVGARFAGMGHASTTLFDLWCVRANQAGLAGLEKPVAGAYYQQHWMAPDLAMQGLAFALPVGKGCFAASANSFGGTLYSERNFGLAYAMRFGDGLRAGVQLDYLDLRLGEGYGSRAAMVAEFGVQARLAKDLWVGAHILNPGQARLGGPYDEKIPTLFRTGLSYTFNERVVLAVEVEKDIDRPERYHAGVEYRAAQGLFLRTGVSSGPVQAHFGAGFRVKAIDIDLAVAVRSQLGLTPMVNLNYRFP
jgi:hypothetical protein